MTGQTNAMPILRPPATETLRFGAVETALAQIAAAEGAPRIVIATSRSQRGSPLLAAAEAGLGASHVATFAEIGAHAPYDDVLALADLARVREVDLIVAIGGGSVIDAAKIAQLCLWYGLADQQALLAFRADPPKDLSAARARPRMVAVPTTLSSAEFTPFAGTTDRPTGRKDAYDHPLMVPKHVLFDARALAATPAAIVATSGARSVDHCIETLCSTSQEPYFAALALAGLRILWAKLPILAAGEAGSSDCRDLLRASWMAISGPAAGVPVGASHAIGRVVGAVSGVQHGHTSAVLLPAVLTWNAYQPACRRRQEEVAADLEIGAPLAEAVRNLFDASGQPASLSAVGVKRGDLAKIADYSLAMLKHPSVAGNARAIASTAEIMDILDLAW